MPDPKPFSSNRDPRYLPPAPSPETRKQQRLMIVALTLLLVALGFVLYRDRDFWFPNTEESESQPTQTVVPGPAAGQRAEARPLVPY